MSFGKIIAEARKKMGLSQKELASKIKKEDGESISPQYLNDIEHDRRNPPSEFIIDQLAKELNLPKAYLVLAAGMFPESVKKAVTTSKPETVEDAFQAFRKTLKRK